MNDLIEEMNLIRRKVGEGKLPAGEAHVIEASRTYPAEIDDVWDALTNPARIPRWFLPITGDLQLGGRYQFQGNAGGEIRVCDPPKRLLVTWNMGEAPPEDASIVEVQLEPSAEGETHLKLEHTAVVPEEFWDQFGPGAVGVGWDGGLIGLAAHLAGVEMGGDPEELAKDPAMRAAYAASSGAWGNALAETGVDEETVAARVAATTAFYAPPLDEQ